MAPAIELKLAHLLREDLCARLLSFQCSQVPQIGVELFQSKLQSIADDLNPGSRRRAIFFVIRVRALRAKECRRGREAVAFHSLGFGKVLPP